MSGQALQDPLESIPLVLGALREALGQLQDCPYPSALLVRVEALAGLLQAAGSLPPELLTLSEHLGAFGSFLRRSLATPDTLAHLAGPTAELCLAWQITTEALAPTVDGSY